MLQAADEDREVGVTFRDWGVPTAASVAQLSGLGLGICATGGVSDGLMVAKALALGATCGGIARPFLQAHARAVETRRFATASASSPRSGSPVSSPAAARRRSSSSAPSSSASAFADGSRRGARSPDGSRGCRRGPCPRSLRHPPNPRPVKQAIKAKLYPPLLPVGALSWPGPSPMSRGAPTAPGDVAGPVLLPRRRHPGCTRQLQDLSDHLDDFQALEAEVFGVNPADGASHLRFSQRYGFRFPLLVDGDGQLSNPLGTRMRVLGRTIRSVYVIDPTGRVALAQRGAPPATELLARIRSGGTASD